MNPEKRQGALRRFLVGDLDDDAHTAPTRAGSRDAGTSAESGTGTGDEGNEEEIKAPWHFKVLVVGTVGYLIYRLIWLIFWLTGHAWNG